MENQPPEIGRELAILAVGAIAVLYLLNPGAGFIELIPDAIPIVGNLDEAAAVTILLAVMRHYGIDMTKLLAKDKEEQPETIVMPPEDETDRHWTER